MAKALDIAPCVAIVGPANAGKTTLLHRLDHQLQKLVGSVLVIKGSPDGTGRYLFFQPDLREAVKPEMKGQWGAPTVERICDWVRNGRRNLELALLDFGGKHDPANPLMLGCCSHFILVSREGDDDNAATWDRVCRDAGLQPLAWIRTREGSGNATIEAQKDGVLQGFLRSDARSPKDSTNDTVNEALIAELLRIRRPAETTPYVDLHLGRDWTLDDLANLAGRATAIRELAGRTGSVALGGGGAPIWAYLAALQCALKENPGARVFFFDPKENQRLIEIPAKPCEGGFPEGVMAVEWTESNTGARLHVRLMATDRLIPGQASECLECMPPFGHPPSGPVELFGARPTWVAGTYARWLWAAGVERLGVWDGRQNGPVWL